MQREEEGQARRLSPAGGRHQLEDSEGFPHQAHRDGGRWWRVTDGQQGRDALVAICMACEMRGRLTVRTLTTSSSIVVPGSER